MWRTPRRYATVERRIKANDRHLAAQCPVYDDHHCDNQGCCHGCGVVMAEDWWHAYAGEDLEPPYKIGPVPERLMR